MPSERLMRILTRLATRDEHGTPARLCSVSADVMQMTGAGVMLMSGDIRRGSVCSSNDVSALIEDLQYTLGEGPCVDAYQQDRPVTEEDLDARTVARWTAFTPIAVDAGARAVFGFPMRVGAIRMGALNFYRDTPGPLTDLQYTDGLMMAGVAARAVLTMQSGAAEDAIGAELEAGADLRFVVHQASGMVAEQLSLTVGQALLRLKAYAYASERRLDDVARDVVARKLHIEA